MRNSVRIILTMVLFLLLTLPASAEQVRLKSGDIIQGSIIFQNEQVLVIKKTDGSRFQYQQSDVEAVLEDEAEEAPKQEETMAAKKKKLTVSLQLAGGMTVLPGSSTGSLAQKGAGAAADLFIGTCNLLPPSSEKAWGCHGGVFLGAGLGYHLHFAGGQPYSFLPIQLRAEAPLTQKKHAPMLGLSAGYGISLQKSAKGGAFADITFGWRYQISDTRAISLGLYSNIQQTKLTNHTDIIDGNTFISPSAGRAFFDFGIRFAAYL